MAAHEHLNPQLFHGSQHRFEPGDTVAPRATTANYREKGYTAEAPAYATTNKDRARAFGRVYEVEPHDWKEIVTEPDESTDDENQYISYDKGFKVIKEVD